MKWAGFAWGAGVLIVLGYEAFAVVNATPNDTLSEWMWRYGQHPMVAFAVGVVSGHLWWQRKGAK